MSMDVSLEGKGGHSSLPPVDGSMVCRFPCSPILLYQRMDVNHPVVSAMRMRSVCQHT